MKKTKTNKINKNNGFAKTFRGFREANREAKRHMNKIMQMSRDPKASSKIRIIERKALHLLKSLNQLYK